MKTALFAVLQLFAITIFAQTNSYTSTIVDDQNLPIPFATVHQVDSNNYTTSSEEGIFTLKTNTKNFTIQISSIGFLSKKITIENGNFPKKIVLQPSAEQLNEIVVTALGIKREKQSLVSSVTTIKPEKLTEVTLTNVVNSLAGQVAGVQVTNGSCLLYTSPSPRD